MPTLATGTLTANKRLPIHAATRQTGFTLLELVVVLLLVGIVLGLATITITARPADNVLKEEATRLHELAQLAAETAIIYGDIIGMLVGPREYGFVVATEAGWQALPDEVFRPRTLGDEYTLELYGQGLADADNTLPVNKKDDDDERDDDAPINPQIVFLGTGEATPFETVLAHDDTDVTYKMTTSITGKVELERVQPDVY